MKYIKTFIACFLVSLTVLVGFDIYTAHIRTAVYAEIEAEKVKAAEEKLARNRGIATMEFEIPCDNASTFLKTMVDNFPAGPMFIGKNINTGYFYHLFLNDETGEFAVSMTNKETYSSCLVAVGDEYQIKTNNTRYINAF